jgi:hypothetical protein
MRERVRRGSAGKPADITQNRLNLLPLFVVAPPRYEGFWPAAKNASPLPPLVYLGSEAGRWV